MYALLLEIAVLIAAGVISYAIGYLIYKKIAVAFWAYISAFLPTLPVTFMSLFGVTNLTLFSWISHTIGIIVLPLLLVLADVLLIEIGLLAFIRPFSAFLPKPVKNAIRIEGWIENLQRHYAIPRPVRVQWVYIVGVIAGMINLILYLAFGLL